MDPIGPPEGAPVAGAAAGEDPADSLAVKYHCALNFNVGGKIAKNKTVERVAEDGPLSPGAFQVRVGGGGWGPAEGVGGQGLWLRCCARRGRANSPPQTHTHTPQCARECNRMGAGCAAFGVVAGTNCYIMSSVRGYILSSIFLLTLFPCAFVCGARLCVAAEGRAQGQSRPPPLPPPLPRARQVNASAGGADSLVTAICMKNQKDWMDLGLARGGERVTRVTPGRSGHGVWDGRKDWMDLGLARGGGRRAGYMPCLPSQRREPPPTPLSPPPRPRSRRGARQVLLPPDLRRAGVAGGAGARGVRLFAAVKARAGARTHTNPAPVLACLAAAAICLQTSTHSLSLFPLPLCYTHRRTSQTMRSPSSAPASAAPPTAANTLCRHARRRACVFSALRWGVGGWAFGGPRTVPVHLAPFPTHNPTTPTECRPSPRGATSSPAPSTQTPNTPPHTHTIKSPP